jgi:uncharacterized membrane protein
MTEAAVQANYDPFGEPVKYDEPRLSAPQGAVGGWLARAGTGVFWAVVVVILIARAAYFDPDLAGKFGQVAALSRALRAMLGA